MGIFDKIFGGSSSKQSPSTVWGGQSPYLQGLYQRAYNASFGMGTGFQPGQNIKDDGIAPGQGQYGRMQPGGPGGLVGGPMQGGQMGGQQWGGDPLQGLGGNLTQQGQGMLGQLGMLGQSGNPFAQAQIGQLGQGLGRLFQQQIMPGITSTFGQAGQLGGSRQALALGQAGEGLGQAFTGGALDILGNSSQLALQANQAGLQGAGNVFNLGNAAMFGSLPGLSSLLGNPAILGGGGQASSTPGILGALSGFVPKG